MTESAFFVPRDDSLVPREVARSYWGRILHGRLIGGLSARAAEAARSDDPEWTCARLTIELFRSAPLAPVTTSTRRIRQGRRVRVIETTVYQEGEPIGQGKALLLRQGEQPAGDFVSPVEWTAPTPAQLGPPIHRPASADGFRAPWDMWLLAPMGESGVRGDVWLRDRLDLVAGEPSTPLIRAAMAADMASPVAHTSTAGLGFINADYTLYLMREPVGHHFGFQRLGQLGHAGVAVGQCVIHDEAGGLGFVGTAAVANRHPSRDTRAAGQ